MKRVIVLLIFILLFAPLVLSQTDSTATIPVNNIADNINAGAEAAKHPVNKVSGALEEERPIPENPQPIVKLFFRFEEKISISQVIIGIMS